MLILVVLTMIVALTVGLSLAARTLVNLRLSKQNEESQRAFQAAEAGVEQIIQSGSESSADNLANNSSYSTSVSYPLGTDFMLNGGELVDQDVGIDIWLSSYPDFSNATSGTLTIYWGTSPNQVDCTKPVGGTGSTVKSAIEVVVLSGNLKLPKMDKYFFEANGCSNRIQSTPSRLGVTSAVGAQPSFTNITFINKANVDYSTTSGIIARVIPIFNASKIGIHSTASLPKQGTIVTSTGTSGQTARKVSYFASYPQIPLEIFPYTLISQ